MHVELHDPDPIQFWNTNSSLPGGGGAAAISWAMEAGRYQNLVGWYSGELRNRFVLHTLAMKKVDILPMS